MCLLQAYRLLHVAAVVTAEPKQAAVHLVHNVSTVEPIDILRNDGPTRDVVNHLVEPPMAVRRQGSKVDLLVKFMYETPKTVGVRVLPPRRDVEIAVKRVGRPQLLARGEAARAGEPAAPNSEKACCPRAIAKHDR